MMGVLDLAQVWWVFALAGGLIAVVALRLIFDPENRREKRRAARMAQLSQVAALSDIEALIRLKSRKVEGREWPFLGNPSVLLERAGMSLSVSSFLVLMACLTVGIGVLGTLAAGPLVGVPAGLLLGFGAPVAVLRAKHARRVQAFTMQLPDALDLMMRGLKVGHPISVTIANVGRTMPDPIGAEFRTMANQISLGDYLTDAMQDLADRMGQEDMDYLAVSISIQHGTGGNLAEMLGTLAKVIRDRIMMRRRVRAISSEGRISAMLLSCLPIVIYGATSITAPDYYGAVSDDSLFMPIACIIVALVVANGLALRKLVTFEI